MENLDPPSPPNQGWENGAFLPFARLHPCLGGDGGLLFHFILSTIAGAFGTQPLKHGSVFFVLIFFKHCIIKSIIGFGSCDTRNNQGRGLPDLDFSAYHKNRIQYLFSAWVHVMTRRRDSL